MNIEAIKFWEKYFDTQLVFKYNTNDKYSSEYINHKIIIINEKLLNFNLTFQKYIFNNFINGSRKKHRQINLGTGKEHKYKCSTKFLYRSFNVDIFNNLAIPINTLESPTFIDLFLVDHEFNKDIKLLREKYNLSNVTKNKKKLKTKIRNRISIFIKNKNINLLNTKKEEIVSHLFNLIMLNNKISAQEKKSSANTSNIIEFITINLLSNIYKDKNKFFPINRLAIQKMMSKYNIKNNNLDFFINFILFNNKGYLINFPNQKKYKVFIKRYLITYFDKLDKNINDLFFRKKTIHNIISNFSKNDFTAYKIFMFDLIKKIFDLSEKFDYKYKNEFTQQKKQQGIINAIKKFNNFTSVIE